jgi:AcrR family transcriptional regulator
VNRRSPRTRSEPYHHGDLSRALVKAAEELLTERGVEGFTLRECARRAGVSHAAPAHHFGDVGGLLTEVAASGFEHLTAAILKAKSRENDPAKWLVLGNLTYVRFAVDHPALFRLMFHSALVDRSSERFRSAGGTAFATLKAALAGLRGPLASDIPAREAWRDPELLEQWALIHGLATLTMEGQLHPTGKKRQLMTALRKVLELSATALDKRRRDAARGRTSPSLSGRG